MINEMCTICGGYIGPAIILSSSSNPPVKRCLGHTVDIGNDKPELVTLPPDTQVFPKNYFYDEKEALWEIVKEVAEEDSTCYNDNDGRMHCPFCTAQTSSFIHEFPHQPDCIIMKARELIKQRELQPRVEFKFHTEAEDAMIVTRVLRWKELMRGKWDKEVIDVTCEQCGERYHGPLEDMRGWYELIEQEPRRNRYAFCSEGHMKQWKADRGVQ